MINVNLVDKRIDKLRGILAANANRKVAPISLDELLNILECLERLSAVERHLYNLTSHAYPGKNV